MVLPEHLRELSSHVLSAAEAAAIKALLASAFGDDEEERFRAEDWEHAIGGRHVLVEVAGEIVGHAAVVERELRIDGRPIRTGYVEAVAIRPDLQGQGLGSRLMAAVNAHIVADYELGALGTGSHGFYERLGWRTWRGPTSVRTADGERPTPEEDGCILVLGTPRLPLSTLDLDARISCDWRVGDVW